ncbi:glycosyltransferase family 4 protein [Paracoccus sp. TK19116]|uniref:Glycosyltransferase family 4 protein n=1 Tax=Paracoccus albicereus TaxID=2922394 RepID=A0ABT1MMU8_9RHOB|nr:glycosyltransferase family 4 protein [Paracoccus albicereus]MCQ0969590.1 glycosyltransferase family 4 protein [Paracoccus albicereus]
MKDLAIIDPCCAKGYAPADLKAGVLGGTEATVLRVTQALSSDLQIIHFQKGRDGSQDSFAGRLCPLDSLPDDPPAEMAVVLNSWKLACKLRKSWPETPVTLWLHIHPGKHNRKMGEALSQAGVEVICVSQSHADTLAAFLPGGPRPRIHVAYNPIDETLAPDETVRDQNQLLFASAPHKGLRQVFAQFAALRELMPDLRLSVADPGYLAWDTGPVPKGAQLLGPLPHDRLIARMRHSLCLFYPQDSFAETFGLVLAEANAVGTPVLVQRGLGANDEVVTDPDQRLDGFDAARVAQRLRNWQAWPPHVVANPSFRLSTVATRWRTLINAMVTPATQGMNA